ncbi:unnamed protein product [Polarella glacialis]|uniref:Methyltransferase domain-containing protein n=1 Tax=Polarella glacialis TaxID=89957 RepID=A0A813HU49_POLGL|nr:unnamed protein product [Polarella glacialis]
MAALSRPKGGFGTLDYWNCAFEDGGEFEEPFDWLASWQDLREEVTALLPNKDAQILIPGCGNAPFQLDMYDAGYTNIVCGDNSEIVIGQMQVASDSAGRRLQWDLMDVTRMPYENCSFQAVIDKSLIDCLHCCDGATQVLRSYLDEVFRILAPGGLFVAVSCHSRPSMKATLRGRSWQTRVDVFGASDEKPLGRASGAGAETELTLSVCIKESPVAVIAGSSSSKTLSMGKTLADRKKAQKNAQKMERRMLQASLEEASLT